jgi:apolipoprotein N-acyltransferase
MIQLQSRPGVNHFFTQFGLMLLGALLFAASFPNLLVENGIPLIAWIAYVPVLFLIHRASLLSSVFWGALYGYAAFGFFNYWLSVFHPLAGLIVGLIYLVFLAVLFFFLKLADILFPRKGYIVQWIIWVAFEYLRIQGFLGYPYGITGYSQWKIIPVIQIAGIFGVWGVSALVIFPSVYLAKCISVKNFFRREKIPAFIWLVLFGAALVYGFTRQADYSSSPAARIALIQHNTDPWRGGLYEYRKNYEVLRRLSGEALASEPGPDMVVWSETAFVPRIYWHTTYRDDRQSYVLVKELLDYLAAQDVPFVIGNDDARKDPLKNPGGDHQIDCNAVMLFEKGELTALYRKLHLVPFTEHFPYKKQLPFVYNALINADTHFWEKGDEATVFSIPEKGDRPSFTFSTPICFEDSFGYLSRDFVAAGADILVNLSNDAWSRSLPAQNQHLSMAVFRAVENRRSMVRSTASGQTCAIGPNGRVLAMAEPFTESWLTTEVPVYRGNTPYTRFGDILPKLFTAAALVLLIPALVLRILKKVKKGKIL